MSTALDGRAGEGEDRGVLFLRENLRPLGVIALLLAVILGRYTWERQQQQARYDRWKQGGEREAAPPAVSGAARVPEEGIHDR